MAAIVWGGVNGDGAGLRGDHRTLLVSVDRVCELLACAPGWEPPMGLTHGRPCWLVVPSVLQESRHRCSSLCFPSRQIAVSVIATQTHHLFSAHFIFSVCNVEEVATGAAVMVVSAGAAVVWVAANADARVVTVGSDVVHSALSLPPPTPSPPRPRAGASRRRPHLPPTMDAPRTGTHPRPRCHCPRVTHLPPTPNPGHKKCLYTKCPTFLTPNWGGGTTQLF